MTTIREERILRRKFYVLDKIAKQLDQVPGTNIIYYTQDPTEYLMNGLQYNELIPGPADEVKILELFNSEDILKIESNYDEYE
ncbi:MAG: hypothetical protein JWN37_779 [Candidatus Nomurabacteria bacterium]|nr:hypothetical protein [Candidatus Nomurabacteria bacterium]